MTYKNLCYSRNVVMGFENFFLCNFTIDFAFFSSVTWLIYEIQYFSAVAYEFMAGGSL